MRGRRYSLLLLGVLIGILCAFLLWPTSSRPVQDRQIGRLAGEGIVVLGTSLSHGDWPQSLGRMLQTCGVESGPVLKITKPGAHSGWGLTQLDEVIEVAPALVLIEFAINDADIRDGLSLETSRHNHQLMLETLSEALPEARVAFMTMSSTSGLKSLSRPFLGRFYAMVAQEAEAADIGLIDLYPRWLKSLKEGVLLPDGLHPLPEDVEQVALPPILEAVAASFGANCIT